MHTHVLAMSRRIISFYCLVAKSYPVLRDPMDCNLPGSSVHWILQARILEWVAISSSRGSSQPKDQTHVSCIAGGFFTVWATALLSRPMPVQTSLIPALVPSVSESLSCVWLFANPWIGAHQAPPSMGFPNQEYWSGLPFPSSGDLPNPGVEHGLPHCRQTLYCLSH